MKFPNACIVQFAKAPRAGRVKTRLMPALGKQGALQLHKQLVTHTWQTLNEMALSEVQLWADCGENIDFFTTLKPAVATPFLQQGADLGERMTQAIAQCLAEYKQVIVVGSDCPVLDEAYLTEAIESLEQGADVVVGPASDGGYVLIGMQRLYGEIFADINWGTGEVFDQTQQRLKDINCMWHQLPERWDVDRPDDLPKLMALELF